jgi:hypothetical protein
MVTTAKFPEPLDRNFLFLDQVDHAEILRSDGQRSIEFAASTHTKPNEAQRRDNTPQRRNWRIQKETRIGKIAL